MDARFHGFSAQVFVTKWFEGLERDNSRAYFGARGSSTRARYAAA